MELTWLPPALTALVMYGLGQGFVKKYIGDVPPARFCLFFVVAKAIVNFSFFAVEDHPPPFAEEGRMFMILGVLAYILDGAGWILYFKSILLGPITIVGTLSAAYPAVAVIFGGIFLHEQLVPLQYLGVVFVIGGCVGLSYEPKTEGSKVTGRAWIPIAAAAVVLWGTAQTIIKYAYGLPGGNEANLAVFNTIGGFLTLGVYGLLYGRAKGGAGGGWGRSMLPMGLMAGGDLGVIIATKTGPISIVTPLTGAYPVVTVAFAYFYLKEKIRLLQIACIALVVTGMILSVG